MLKNKLLVAIAGSCILASSYASAEDLTVWCWDDHFNVPAARLAAEKFKKNHPDVNVKVESIAQDQVIQKLNAALGANNVKGLADIVLIEDYRVRSFLEGYPGFLKPLDGIVDYNNFIDSKVAATTADGHTYGVPFDSGVTGVFIRKDLFEQAGYTLDDFKDYTWDDFIAMGKKVKEVTGRNLMPFDSNDLMEVRIMMQSGGEWYTSQDGKTANIAGNKALREAMEVMKKLKDANVLEYYSGWNALLPTFQGDKVAAVVSACWLTASVAAGTDLAGKWAVVPIPKLQTVANPSNVSNQGGSQWFVNGYSKNADTAAKFLAETFGSDRDLINELVPKIGLITTMKNAADLSNYQEGDAYFGGQKVNKDFVTWAEKIPAVNYGSYTKAVETLVQEALQRIMMNGEDVDEVLKDTQSMVEMQIAQ